MSVTGTWDLTLSTPIGRIRPTTRIAQEDGDLSGVAWSEGEESDELVDPTPDGDRLTWRHAVTRPMRLNLVFALTECGGAGTVQPAQAPGPLRDPGA